MNNPATSFPLDTKPWNSILYDIPPNVRKVPTMLTEEEGRMLCWLAEHVFSGQGAICELGTFVGGSTARLASGLRRNTRASGTIDCFDRYGCSENQKQKLLYRFGIPPFAGEDILPIAKTLLKDFEGIIRFHKGDILDVNWVEGPIEILFVDIAKSVEIAEHLARVFYPSLIPDVSILVHQDYLYPKNPWIIHQMEMLQDYFDFVSNTEDHSVLFRCKKIVPAANPAIGAWQSASTEEKIAVIRRAARHFPFLRQRQFIAESIRMVTEYPNVTKTWSYKAAAPTLPLVNSNVRKL